MSAAPLVSFDIDGTLEIGDPPGVIPIALVRRAQQLGYLVGSCSDRPISFQQAMWKRLDVVADFTALKHRLGDLKAQFDAARYYHVGDTDIDEHFATLAGFRFLRADAVAQRAWGAELFPDWATLPARTAGAPAPPLRTRRGRVPPPAS